MYVGVRCLGVCGLVEGLMVKGLVDLGGFGSRGDLGTKEAFWFLTNGLACVLEKEDSYIFARE